MRLTPNGAVRNVTGSKHLLEVGGSRILLDCGLFQGKREESERKNRSLPFDPEAVDTVLLTHAHIDHCGSLPTLVKGGFGGPIHATAATTDLAGILLRDTAYIQLHDLEYLNKRRIRRGEIPIEPVYDEEDVEATLPLLTPIAYDEPRTVAPGVEVTFRDAGHILGSAILEIDAVENGTRARIVYTGDLGRKDMPILRDPYQVTVADVFVTESTYGSRKHSPMGEVLDKLARFVTSVIERRGKIIVPSFAVGRTQRVVYELHQLMRSNEIPGVPIYVDSPLAVRATEIFREHRECFDAEMLAMIDRGDDPLGFSRVTYVEDVADSKELNHLGGPAIIISASGMCEAGRVLHHLHNSVGSSRNAVMIVGYQAENTLGRRLAEGVRSVRILGEMHRVRASVAVFDEFSAHADSDELVEYAEAIRRRAPARTIVVHGSEMQSLELARRLTERGFADVIVPRDGETIEL
jgi:metallo-beta-lactamase family protein